MADNGERIEARLVGLFAECDADPEVWAGVDTIPGIFTTSLNGSLNRAWRFGEGCVRRVVQRQRRRGGG